VFHCIAQRIDPHEKPKGPSMALMIAAIAVITWAAARISRVGILMYGKRPTFPEIIRWIGRP